MSSLINSITEKTFDNFKKLSPALVAIALIAGMILFLPASLLSKMNLDNLPALWKSIIGIVFLLSVALILTILVFSLVFRIEKSKKTKKALNDYKKLLLSLSPTQKDIVSRLIKSDDKTIVLDSNSGDTIYLLNARIIFRPGQFCDYGLDNKIYMTYVPHPWLQRLYLEEPELFK